MLDDQGAGLEEFTLNLPSLASPTVVSRQLLKEIGNSRSAEVLSVCIFYKFRPWNK